MSHAIEGRNHRIARPAFMTQGLARFKSRLHVRGWLGSTPEGGRPQIGGFLAGGSLAVANSTPATPPLSPAKLLTLNHAQDLISGSPLALLLARHGPAVKSQQYILRCDPFARTGPDAAAIEHEAFEGWAASQTADLTGVRQRSVRASSEWRLGRSLALPGRT